MEKVEYLRKVLLEEYGIKNDKELKEAIKKLTPINIGIFTSPVNCTLTKEAKQGA